MDISKVRWPEGVKEIYLWGFNRRIDGVLWPVGLKILSFQKPPPIFEHLAYGTAGIFNMPLGGVTFPAGLREIFLGHEFNQPIDTVAWPEGLERLSMPCFNKPIHDVHWPEGLKSLEFMTPYRPDDPEFREEASLDRRDGCFNQPLGSFLPPNLEFLWLSNSFYQSLGDVAWPSELAVLGLGTEYLVGEVKWPPRLETLVLPRCFSDMEDPPPGCRVVYTEPQGASDSDEDEMDTYHYDYVNYDSSESDV
ncbi:unnamed protein product [Laminaria digitata]